LGQDSAHGVIHSLNHSGIHLAVAISDRCGADNGIILIRILQWGMRCGERYIKEERIAVPSGQPFDAGIRNQVCHVTLALYELVVLEHDVPPMGFTVGKIVLPPSNHAERFIETVPERPKLLGIAQMPLPKTRGVVP